MQEVISLLFNRLETDSLTGKSLSPLLMLCKCCCCDCGFQLPMSVLLLNLVDQHTLKWVRLKSSAQCMLMSVKFEIKYKQPKLEKH